MKITVIVSDFGKEHENYFKQLMTFIKGYTPSLEVIIITDKVSQYTSVADSIDVIEFGTCDSEIIVDYLAIRLNSSRRIIFDSSILSRELVGRLSVKLNIPGLIDIRSMKIEEENIIFSKYVYAANLVAEFASQEFCIALSRTVPISEEILIVATTMNIHEVSGESSVEVLSVEPMQKEQHKDMLIVIGRGVDAENDLDRIKELAVKMDAELGASRPVCMSGYVSLEHLVGVSGKIYNPKLCVTLGVSGSLAFYPGIEKSKRIISINEDEDAPIMQNSDYCIQSDYKEVVKYLENLWSGSYE